jgi:AcrR family transcriptional regulator
LPLVGLAQATIVVTMATQRRANGDRATRERMVEAAITCILERGFYRASSNEIARQAGVSWGVIQHHFGTREALLVAVLEDGARRFTETVEKAAIDGDTPRQRMEQLVDILVAYYGSREYLADVQILLNMEHDPNTSLEVRRTMQETAKRSFAHVRRLLTQAIGDADASNDLLTTLYLLVRGFGLSQQLLDTMSYDVVTPRRDRTLRQRAQLVDFLTPYFEAIVPQ